MLSFPECVTWLAVGLTECVAIVTLNIVTIIVFIKNRNLRKRSTYLVINLAVVDMLVGGIATDNLFYFVGAGCNIWKYNLLEAWLWFVKFTLHWLFPLCSITNITAISLERLYATLRPFRHLVIKQFVYGIVIAVAWVTAGLLSIAHTVLLEFKFGYYIYSVYLILSFFVVCLLVLCVSYSSIVIKVRCGAQPLHHSAASRERKLTMTLLIMTVVSLLLYLPLIIIWHLLLSEYEIISSMSELSFSYLIQIILILFYANSLVNPILYAIRMPEYRSAVLALFRRRPQQRRQVAVLPLNDM